MNTTETRKLVDKLGVVTLVADMTEEFPAANELLEELGNPNHQIPYYAIFPAGRPGEPILLDGLILPSQIQQALEQAGPSRPRSATQTAQR